MKLDLDSIETPQLEVTLRGGKQRIYDPLDMVRRLEPFIARFDQNGMLPSELFQELRGVWEVTTEEANDYHLVKMTMSVVQMFRDELQVKEP